ncbi:MAG: thioredoxin family protein [Nocardioides sp.]
MSAGAWVLLAAVVVALVGGAWWSLTNGVFRGTHRVRGGLETGAERLPPPSVSVLAGTAYDAQRGDRATLLQFSSAFCAPCRATRRTLADVAGSVPGVTHVEIDAEHHLDLVRALGVLRTPTTLVLDGQGRETTRATGAPRPGQVLAALESGIQA